MYNRQNQPLVYVRENFDPKFLCCVVCERYNRIASNNQICVNEIAITRYFLKKNIFKHFACITFAVSQNSLLRYILLNKHEKISFSGIFLYPHILSISKARSIHRD